MDVIKQYSGTIEEDTLTKTIHRYGKTGTLDVKQSKTEKFNSILAEFLAECGVDAEYDGNYLWVNGYPIVFYFSGTYNYYYYSLPFTTSDTSFTTYGVVFSGTTYNFKLRLLGEPTSAFVLLISYSVATPAFYSSPVFRFYKAKNILSGRDARIISTGTGSKIAAVDLDESGLPVDIDRNSEAATDAWTISTLATDFTDNPDKVPLVECIQGIFKMAGCYKNFLNDSFPKAASNYADAQVFLKIGDGVYYRDYVTCLIKCDT